MSAIIMTTFTLVCIASVISASPTPQRIGRQVNWPGSNFGNFLPSNNWQNEFTGNNWGSKPNANIQDNFGSENGGNERPWTFSPTRPTRPDRPGSPQRPTRPPTTALPLETTTPPIVPNLVLFNAPEGCDCPRTGQFNPVCGTDSNTYVNLSLMKCFQQCGTKVEVRYQGSCRRNARS